MKQKSWFSFHPKSVNNLQTNCFPEWRKCEVRRISILAGTEFMGGTGGTCPPNFWTGGDIISFVPPNIL